MAKATITLEDKGEGKFLGQIEYEGGFLSESLAQQWGLLLMRQLGQWTDPVGSEQVFGDAPTMRIPNQQEQDRV